MSILGKELSGPGTAPNVARVDPMRLQVITYYAGHRWKANLDNPRHGGTGHTMAVCERIGVPYEDQRGGWKGFNGFRMSSTRGIHDGRVCKRMDG